MLALMIHAHPRLAMPPETRFLISTWRRRHEFGALETSEQRKALARAVAGKGSKVRDLGLRPKRVRRLIRRRATTVGSAFALVFRAHARLHGKARWGDKRPMYYQEVDVLLRLFPDAQIVHIIRDGRDNVASLKRMPWWVFDSISSMAEWAFAEQCMRRNLRRLPADTFYALRYESLVSDPRIELTRLCAFLGEEFAEVMLDPSQVADVLPDRKPWHGGLRSSVNEGAIETWRTGLEGWEVGLMETMLGRALTRNGYPLAGTGLRPSPALRLNYLVAAARLQAHVRRRWWQEVRESHREQHPVAALRNARRRRG